MFAIHARTVGALIAAVAAICLAGCATAPNPGSPGASPNQTTPAWITPAGCWLPGSTLTTCGDMVTVDGNPPTGPAIDMTGTYDMSSPGLTADGLTMLVLHVNDPCPSQSFNVPVRADGNQWVPDATQMSGPALGCFSSTGGPDVSWVRDMFSSPMAANWIDANTLRISSADTSQLLYVDFKWA